MTGAAGKRHEFRAPFAELEEELFGRGPDWLRRGRRSALRRFDSVGLPTTREEEWRTTSVAPIAKTAFRPAGPATGDLTELSALARLDPEIPRLVFVDGRIVPRLSSPAPAQRGLWAGSLARALETIPERLERYWFRRDPDACPAFCALNMAYAEDGAVLLVDDGVEIEQPIQLVFAASPSAEPFAVHPRTLIVAGDSSRLSVVESYLGDSGVYLTNAVTDVFVGRGATVRHDRVQAESEAAYHISTIQTYQAGASRYHGLNLNLGGRLVRHDVRAELDGEQAICDLDGLCLTRGDQHLDNQTTIDHRQPRCESREVYKGVLAGSSRATFRGRIIVRPGAQQTDAKQFNPSLLLSAKALTHTRPQLEIYADDVKCTHGATVGRLDEEAIFYLRSRGIGAVEARDLLISAFADEVLDRVELDSLRRQLKQAVAERLPTMKG